MVLPKYLLITIMVVQTNKLFMFCFAEGKLGVRWREKYMNASFPSFLHVYLHRMTQLKFNPNHTREVTAHYKITNSVSLREVTKPIVQCFLGIFCVFSSIIP